MGWAAFWATFLQTHLVTLVLNRQNSCHVNPNNCKIIFFQAFAGRDASQAFLSYHRKAFPHSRAKEAFHADDKSVTYSEKDNADFLELCERVHKVYIESIFETFSTGIFSILI
jgi:hypothetical protein